MVDLVSEFLKCAKQMGESPILLLAGLVVGVISLTGIVGYGQFGDATKSIAGFFSSMVIPLIIMPFMTGGALGYAAEARKKGSSSLSTFTKAGVQNYARMFAGALLAFIVFYILYIAVLSSGAFMGLGDPLAGMLLFLLTGALAFVCLMGIEFYDISIVGEGAGVVAAFKNSIAFVRRNLPSAAGFFIIVLILKAAVMAPLYLGQTEAMMSNETYSGAIMNLSSVWMNSSMNVSANATAANETGLNMTSVLGLGLPPMSVGSLAAVGIVQALLQGFVFAFLALYKAEFYLSEKSHKRITDFDYDFSGSGPGGEPRP